MPVLTRIKTIKGTALPAATIKRIRSVLQKHQLKGAFNLFLKQQAKRDAKIKRYEAMIKKFNKQNRPLKGRSKK